MYGRQPPSVGGEVASWMTIDCALESDSKA
ncbi:hypothetical protein CCP3SC1AL1_1570001 [Gammaproteobacteria bacterium]